MSYEDDPRTGGFFYVTPGKTLNSSHTSLGGTSVGVFGYVVSSFWFFFLCSLDTTFYRWVGREDPR